MRKLALLTALVILGTMFVGCAKDETPPVISAISSSAISVSSAAITWTTDEKATSEVVYDTVSHANAADYQWKSVLDTDLVKTHSVELTGLTRNAVYHCRVKSVDSSDNEAVSSDSAFVLQPQLGSEWTYNVLFEKADTGAVTDYTTWMYSLAALNVMPVDLSPCPTVPSAIVSSKIPINHTAGGTKPIRQPTTAPGVINYHNSTYWTSSNPSDGILDQLQYWALDGIIFGVNLRQEWAYHNYTLVSGTNIGIPYTIGNSWRYNVTSAASISGAVPGSGNCEGIFNWPFIAEVVAANLTVTVPAGTFTDVIQIDHYCDWNLDGVFERGNATASELTNTYYWSPTAMGNVKWLDYLTFDGPPGGTGGSNIGPPPDFTELYELASYSLIWA